MMSMCKYRNLDGMCNRLYKETENDEDIYFCGNEQACLYGFIRLGKHCNLMQIIEVPKQEAAQNET